MQLELQLTSALDLKEKDERIYMYIRKSNSLENTGIITEKKRPSVQENILIKKGEYDRGTPFSRISNTWPPNDKKSA